MLCVYIPFCLGLDAVWNVTNTFTRSSFPPRSLDLGVICSKKQLLGHYLRQYGGKCFIPLIYHCLESIEVCIIRCPVYYWNQTFGKGSILQLKRSWTCMSVVYCCNEQSFILFQSCQLTVMQKPIESYGQEFNVLLLDISSCAIHQLTYNSTWAF